MAAATPTFVTRPTLGLGVAYQPPRARPPWRREYGSYCLKAQCDVYDGEGRLAARVMGYDRYTTIQQDVENACRLEAGRMPGARCSEARLTMLGDYRKECAGEVYFVVDGEAQRLW